ncbi:hypothetical protein L873DRAFT_1661202, partial [Choiromyces venosus 120613-1]
LESIIIKYKIQACNMYNIDEIGFLLGLGQSEHILEVIRKLHENGELKFHTQKFITVIEGIYADGTWLQPMIILKAEGFVAEWFQKVKGIPEDILFSQSCNG